MCQARYGIEERKGEKYHSVATQGCKQPFQGNNFSVPHITVVPYCKKLAHKSEHWYFLYMYQKPHSR